MPFVVMCGIPCSGKTTRAEELKSYITQNRDVKVKITGDRDVDGDKNNICSDPKREKDVRGYLKSAVQRIVSKDEVTILDSSNYIKGYRYELYCVTKAAQTPHCTIHCEVATNVASEWNQQRPMEDRYSQQIFDALVRRFEAPESRNRWDSPLFLVNPEDKLPCEDICDALFKRKAPPPNMATQSQPISSTNFLHELDKITQTIITVVLDAQKVSVPGDSVTVPEATDKIELVRPLTSAELQRMRRQFITYSKLHPVECSAQIANMFVQFVNNGSKS